MAEQTPVQISPVIVSSDENENGDLYEDSHAFVIEGGVEIPGNFFMSQNDVTLKTLSAEKSQRRSYHSVSSNSDDDRENLSSNLVFSQPETPSRKNKNDVRSLQCKSKSEGNFSRSSDFSMQQGKLVSNDEIYEYLGLCKSDVDIFDDSEAREDFAKLSSPELNLKLAFYGLRSQKRHLAIRLLDYIYEETHPQVPAHLLLEKENLISNEQEVGCESDAEEDLESLKGEIEEMELAGEEYDEEEVREVQKYFRAIINSNKTIYHDVLMYKPLGLESLHEKLKDEGLKCGIKVLADYLDDECIAYCIECPKKSRGKLKKKTHR